MQYKLKQAMIFAAGIGSRLSPITNTIPKALVQIYGVPILEQLICKLKNEGFERIVINVHHFAQQIIDFLDEKKYFSLDIVISDEIDNLMDTGGGLVKARNLFHQTESILLYNVDILSNICIADMFAYHIKNSPLATLAVRNRKTSRYLEFDNNLNLVDRYKPNYRIGTEDEWLQNNQNICAFSGIHIINPEIFDLVIESGKFSIIDLYLRLCKENLIKGYPHNDDTWFDCGDYQKVKSMI